MRLFTLGRNPFKERRGEIEKLLRRKFQMKKGTLYALHSNKKRERDDSTLKPAC